MTDEIRFQKAKKASNVIWFLPIGILLMVLSVFEQSPVWTVMICVTGWCGIAKGLGATTVMVRLLNFALYQIGWFACVFDAIRFSRRRYRELCRGKGEFLAVRGHDRIGDWASTLSFKK